MQRNYLAESFVSGSLQSVVGGGKYKKVATFLVLLLCVTSHAQPADSSRYTGWALKTNALEWLLTVPNLNFEADLSSSPYNKKTLGVTVTYNWQTAHKYTPYYAFNLLDIRPEFRYYFRTHLKGKDTKKKNYNDFDEWVYYSLAERKKPKEWRAYYMGAYADYANYAFKFSPEGIQGYAIGLGATVGYGIPLYQYKKFAIDLELGASLGFVMTKYDKFAHNSEGYYYYPTEQKNLHFVPFPVVSELKVAFAIRPVSIKDKYKGEDPAKIEYRRKMDDISTNFKSSSKEEFDFRQDPDQLRRYAANDSLYIADFTANLDETYNNAVSDVENSTISKEYKKKALARVKAIRKETLDAFMSVIGKKNEAAGETKKETVKEKKKKKVAKEEKEETE